MQGFIVHSANHISSSSIISGYATTTAVEDPAVLSGAGPALLRGKDPATIGPAILLGISSGTDPVFFGGIHLPSCHYGVSLREALRSIPAGPPSRSTTFTQYHLGWWVIGIPT